MELFDTTSRIAVLESQLTNLGSDLKEFRQDSKEQHKQMMEKISDIDERLTTIEKWRWMIIGGSIVIGYLVSHLLPKLS
jgi:TolA-binding protein